jgi:hypothetical protein
MPGAKIYDPVGGSGTTYFQALLLDRRPVTTEICKVSVEYMKSLFILFSPKVNFNNILKNIEKMINKFNGDTNYVACVPERIYIDKLRPWYSNETMNQLSFLFIEEERCNDFATKAAIRISISAILKTVSSQDRGWGCIADNMIPKNHQMKDKNVLQTFKRHISKLIKDISDHLKVVTPDYIGTYQNICQKQSIFNSDVKNCESVENDSIDLVVTSPPYPNMTDYITSQRLSYYFFGFDLQEDKVLEIGARHKRSKKSSLNDYLKDMKIANERIAMKIKRGGYACYVMPSFNTKNENNMKRKKIVQSVMASLEDYDLIKEAEFERSIPSKRRSHNVKWASLEKEKIHLYKKG